MKKIPLQDRIAGLNGGAAIDDEDFAVELLRGICEAPLSALVPRQHYRDHLAKRLGKEPEEVENMRIGKIANLIEELWAVADTHELAADAAWDLAAPYLWEARKRDRG